MLQTQQPTDDTMTTQQQRAQPECPTAKPRRHRPYKRRLVPSPFLAIPDGRCRDGRALRIRRAALVAHCGGTPSAVQAILIDRAINLEWQSMQLDRLAAAATGQQAIDLLEQSDKLANTLGRCLTRLGLGRAKAKPLTAAQYLAARAAASPAA
jgi:hypothetical protein